MQLVPAFRGGSLSIEVVIVEQTLQIVLDLIVVSLSAVLVKVFQVRKSWVKAAEKEKKIKK